MTDHDASTYTWSTQTPFQVMDIFMGEAAKRGILVMFDLHQIDPTKGFDPVRRL